MRGEWQGIRGLKFSNGQPALRTTSFRTTWNQTQLCLHPRSSMLLWLWTHNLSEPFSLAAKCDLWYAPAKAVIHLQFIYSFPHSSIYSLCTGGAKKKYTHDLYSSFVISVYVEYSNSNTVFFTFLNMYTFLGGHPLYLLSTHHMPGIILSAGDLAVYWTDILSPLLKQKQWSFCLWLPPGVYTLLLGGLNVVT